MAEEPSAFRLSLAASMDLETLRLIIMLVQEHYEQTGSWPTPTAIREKLKRPGL